MVRFVEECPSPNLKHSMECVRETLGHTGVECSRGRACCSLRLRCLYACGIFIFLYHLRILLPSWKKRCVLKGIRVVCAFLSWHCPSDAWGIWFFNHLRDNVWPLVEVDYCWQIIMFDRKGKNENSNRFGNLVNCWVGQQLVRINFWYQDLIVLDISIFPVVLPIGQAVFASHAILFCFLVFVSVGWQYKTFQHVVGLKNWVLCHSMLELHSTLIIGFDSIYGLYPNCLR